MKWKKWLENWDMTSLKINVAFLEMEWAPSVADKNAAWDLYIELLTRVTTQELEIDHGDEETALNSLFSLFATTRKVIKDNGRDCIEFTKIAVVILNQKVRPFTAKWHKVSASGGFKDQDNCIKFRDELAQLQKVLQVYTRMLADMADIEDLTKFEK